MWNLPTPEGPINKTLSACKAHSVLSRSPITFCWMVFGNSLIASVAKLLPRGNLASLVQLWILL